MRAAAKVSCFAKVPSASAEPPCPGLKGMGINVQRRAFVHPRECAEGSALVKTVSQTEGRIPQWTLVASFGWMLLRHPCHESLVQEALCSTALSKSEFSSTAHRNQVYQKVGILQMSPREGLIESAPLALIHAD